MPEPKPARPSRWWYLVFLLVVAGIVWALLSGEERSIPFSDFRRLVAQDRIEGTVTVGESAVRSPPGSRNVCGARRNVGAGMRCVTGSDT